jgi:hypothetical protein
MSGGGLEPEEALGAAQEAAREASAHVIRLIEARRAELDDEAASRSWARLSALHALAGIQSLLALDELWTLQLEAARDDSDTTLLDHPEAAATWVRQVENGVDAVSPSIEVLSRVLDDESPELFNGALHAIVDRIETKDLRNQVFEVAHEIDWLETGKAACKMVLEQADGEKELLEAKLAHLLRHELPEGDLRPEYKCALNAAAIAAAAAGTIGLGGAPIFVGLAVIGPVTQSLLSWKTTGCPELASTVAKFFRRRR